MSFLSSNFLVWIVQRLEPLYVEEEGGEERVRLGLFERAINDRFYLRISCLLI